MADCFGEQFQRLTGHAPLAWQRRIFCDYFAQSELPDALDIPTGLGKTSVMTLWYLAHQAGASLPRRLIYVVDRRSVVDQATAIALSLKEADPALRISTLRGRFIDNRAWRETPTRCAIVVGTVDMIGSRLLFSGYGVGQWARPYHAGLLGCDSLIVLDEAHLVPPFEQLLADIRRGLDRFGPRAQADRAIVPPFRLLSLSATGRDRPGEVFRLRQTDLDDITQKRLDARKRLIIEPTISVSELALAMAERAWERASGNRHVIIFCNSRKVAEGVHACLHARLWQKLGRSGRDNIEMIVGARRVFEREALTHSRIFRRFAPMTAVLARAEAGEQPGFLVCTSAGEVGIDLDAEHMVCDLVAWERMVQRLGRVNRIGSYQDHTALIDVFPATFEQDNEAEDAIDDSSLRELRAPFESPLWEAGTDGRRDASPGALRLLRDHPDFCLLAQQATTPPPLRPGLTRATLDAWSMTSLDDHTGRPEVTPWLRGWAEAREPQTTVVWRHYLPVRLGGGEASDREIETFFNAAPPHTSELLETETRRVLDWLIKRARATDSPRKADPSDTALVEAGPAENMAAPSPATVGAAPLQPDDQVAFVLTASGDLKRRLTLEDLREARGRSKDQLDAVLRGSTLVVDKRLKGLSSTGLLDDRDERIPPTADDGGFLLADGVVLDIGFQIVRRSAPAGAAEPHGAASSFITKLNAEAEPEQWLEIITRTTEASRAIAHQNQLLEAHVSAVERHATQIADDLGLAGEHRAALLLAARLHDEGKRATRWQRGFSAPDERIYGKTKGPVRHADLRGYRHEFGSLSTAEAAVASSELPPSLQDLALHLIAAHHGRARPVIETEGCEEAPPFLLAARARAVAMRFARLQQQWGPWGLAWWECLLRAADQSASRENDETSSASG